MPDSTPKPIWNTVTGNAYKSISEAVQKSGYDRNTIQYWLAKSLSGKWSYWEYL